MKLADVGLAELQVFDAVYRYRSVVEAGRVLDLPQPTVSRWLGKLREHFGDSLFIRTTHGMEPTAAADAYAGPIRDILMIYRDRLMQERSFEPLSSQRNFRIAASDFGQLTILTALDEWTAETAPGIRLTGVPLGRETLLEGLETGEIDLAVGGFPALVSGVIEQTLYEDQYVCALRADHPILAAPVTIDAFRAASHIVVSARTGGHVHQQVEDMLLQIVPPANIRIVSDSFSLAPMLIRRTDHILTVPRRVALLFQDRLGLKTIAPPVDLPHFLVKQYWHERAKHDPGHQWLRQGIVKLLGARAAKSATG
jgi:DNA-binding transcriptional LysR family regulator